MPEEERIPMLQQWRGRKAVNQFVIEHADGTYTGLCLAHSADEANTYMEEAGLTGELLETRALPTRPKYRAMVLREAIYNMKILIEAESTRRLGMDHDEMRRYKSMIVDSALTSKAKKGLAIVHYAELQKKWCEQASIEELEAYSPEAEGWPE